MRRHSYFIEHGCNTIVFFLWLFDIVNILTFLLFNYLIVNIKFLFYFFHVLYFELHFKSVKGASLYGLAMAFTILTPCYSETGDTWNLCSQT